MVKIQAMVMSVFCLAAALPVYGGDIAKTMDGKVVRGHMETVPSLIYSFGSVEFTPDEIARIEIDPSQNKAKYRTQNYLTFIGKLDHNGRQEISSQFAGTEADEIIAVELSEPGKHPFYPKNIWSIEFKNGNQLPVQFAEKIIPLKGGLLTTSTIEDISVDRGISGTIKIDGKIHELNHAEPKDTRLRVKIATKNTTYRFPWASITRIYRPIKEEHEPEKVYNLGVKGTRKEVPEKTDLLGLTHPEKPNEIVQEREQIAEIVHPPKPNLPKRGCSGFRINN